MHGLVPLSRKLFPRDGIPPVFIEATVRKPRQLREAIADTFEDDVEDEQIVDHEG